MRKSVKQIKKELGIVGEVCLETDRGGSKSIFQRAVKLI